MSEVLTRHGHLTPAAAERLATELRDGAPDPEPGFGTAARAHHEACTACRARVAELVADAPALPPLRHPRRPPRWLAGAGAALALAAGVLVATRPGAPGPGPDAGLRPKGGLLHFEVRDAAGLTLGDDAVVRPGDRLRFLVRVAVPSALVVWGRDASGAAYPIASVARRAPSPAPELLPDALELDAIGDRETLVALACPLAPDAAVVGCALRSVRLVKARASGP